MMLKTALLASPEEIKSRARRWYAKQIEVSQKALGGSWPALEEWVIGYLREEVRRRLIDKYGFRERRR
jgi:hypothetical protein